LTSADTRDGSDPTEVRVLTRGSSVGIVGVVLSQASVFLIVLMLAAAEGTAGVGVYSQCYALFSLATLLALFGARTTLTRFVADRLPDTWNHEGVRVLLKYGLSLPLAVSVVLALGLFLLAPVLGESLFDDPDVITPLQVLAPALPFAAT
jgi:O-antigen/teichoic acid export membrane protein